MNTVNKKQRHGSSILVIVVMFILCIFSCIYFFIMNEYEMYSYLVFLPMTFFCVFVLLIYPIIQKYRSYTAIMFTISAILRYVILPIRYATKPALGFANFATSDADILKRAILLMIYELIIAGFFIFFICFKKKPLESLISTQPVDIGFVDGKIIIVFFICFTIIVLAMFPSLLNRISLFVISSSTGVRKSRIDINTIDNIVLQIFILGLYSILILLINRYKGKYEQTNNVKYVRRAIMVSIIIIGIIIDESRSAQIYVAFAAIYLLSRCFPEHRNKIIIILLLTVTSIFIFMTIYRIFGVYNEKSYISALKNTDIKENLLTSYFETYLLGPQSIASAFELKNKFGYLFTLDRLIYDILRSFLGTNFLVKNIDMQTTSNIYNTFIYGHHSQSGQFLQITAQGYLYFGWLFSPVLLCLFIRLSMFLEKIFLNSKSIYVIFFASFIFIRTSTIMIAGTFVGFVGAISRILVPIGLVYLTQKITNALTL